MRFVDALEERAYRRELDAEHVALLCPPAFQPLFREAVLTRHSEGPAVKYAALVREIRKKGLDPADGRAGYILHQLSLSAESLGDAARARADASAFASEGAGSPGAPGLRIAAAILRGACAASPEDAALAREVLNAYERVRAGADPAEAPFAAYALGTAYEVCGMRDEALSCYEEAMRAGRLDLAMQALVRAVYAARGDEERLRLVGVFVESTAGTEPWTDEYLEKRLAERGWGDYSRLMSFGRRYEGVMSLGRPLLPLRSSVPEGAARFDALLAEHLLFFDGLGRGFEWWEDLIVCAEPAFETFPAKLGMLERLLDAVLEFEETYFDIRDVLHQQAREVYYRLYGETGDERWLDCAIASQLKLRPLLGKYENYIRGEIAFMRGEYRRHFDLVARHYLEHYNNSSLPDERSFIGKTMRGLEIRAGGKMEAYEYALNRHLGDLRESLYEKGVSYRDPAEDRLRLYDAGELPPPFLDFSDADVHEKSR